MATTLLNFNKYICPYSEFTVYNGIPCRHHLSSVLLYCVPHLCTVIMQYNSYLQVVTVSIVLGLGLAFFVIF